MRSLSSRFHANRRRMRGQGVHQRTDLFEPFGKLLGRDLFVRKRELAHLGRVKNRVLQWKNVRRGAVLGIEAPSLDGGPDSDLPHLFARPDAIIHVRSDQRRNRANQGAKERRNFWGY